MYKNGSRRGGIFQILTRRKLLIGIALLFLFIIYYIYLNNLYFIDDLLIDIHFPLVDLALQLSRVSTLHFILLFSPHDKMKSRDRRYSSGFSDVFIFVNVHLDEPERQECTLSIAQFIFKVICMQQNQIVYL